MQTIELCTVFEREVLAMKSKTSDRAILNNATEVVKASQSIDYKGVLAHDEVEVAKLNRVLQKLRINPARVKRFLQQADPAQPGAGGGPSLEDQSRQERLQRMTQALAGAGFEERIDKVYNSYSKQRLTPIDKVPHHRGLPKFQLVVAPDFSPMSGMHGIFIVGNTVRSFVLPANSQGGWQLVKQKSFATIDQMADIVTMICSGFDP